MPYKEVKIEELKLYYSIGEVAELFSVNTSLIRFWEKEFDVLKPKKNKKGNRLFTKEDVENLHRIYRLVKKEGYTLDGAKKMLKGNAGANSTSDKELAVKLKAIKHKLENLKLIIQNQ
jgi:DNA-binding transcriptional MerR regulator